MDQRELVGRAKRGDHDAFAAARRPCPRAAGRGSSPHPSGPGARARRGPGGTHPGLARPAGPPRPGSVRRLAPSPDRQCLSRPRPAPATASDRSRDHPARFARDVRRLGRPGRPRAGRRRPSVASIPAIARSSLCTTSSGCRCHRWRRPWASPSARPSPGCTTRLPRCACPRRPNPTRPRTRSREGRSHDH